MAITNQERVGKAMELLRAGLAPFVERELKSQHQEKATEAARRYLGDDRTVGKKPVAVPGKCQPNRSAPPGRRGADRTGRSDRPSAARARLPRLPECARAGCPALFGWHFPRPADRLAAEAAGGAQ